MRIHERAGLHVHRSSDAIADAVMVLRLTRPATWFNTQHQPEPCA